jgi:thiol-disulfide isomerase/thioredoxin
MMPSKKKKGWIGIVATTLTLAAAAVWWQAEPPFSSAVRTTDGVVPGTVDHYFKKLGIIKGPGMAPPVDFELADLKGRRVRLSDFTDQVVFLHFWTTWCSQCRIEMPMLENLYQHLKGREFAMLAVSLRESESKVSQYVNREKLNFTTLLDSDGRVGRRFGIRSIPTTIIIDQGGAMIGKIIGSRNWNSPAAKAFFEQLINHPPGRSAAGHP